MTDLTTDEVTDLALELVRDLAEHIGDRDAVNDVMREWLEDLGARAFGFVAACAAREVFSTCLTHTPIDDIPAGSVVFTDQEGRTDDRPAA